MPNGDWRPPKPVQPAPVTQQQMPRVAYVLFNPDGHVTYAHRDKVVTDMIGRILGIETSEVIETPKR